MDHLAKAIAGTTLQRGLTKVLTEMEGLCRGTYAQLVVILLMLFFCHYASLMLVKREYKISTFMGRSQ